MAEFRYTAPRGGIKNFDGSTAPKYVDRNNGFSARQERAPPVGDQHCCHFNGRTAKGSARSKRGGY